MREKQVPQVSTCLEDKARLVFCGHAQTPRGGDDTLFNLGQASVSLIVRYTECHLKKTPNVKGSWVAQQVKALAVQPDLLSLRWEKGTCSRKLSSDTCTCL